MLISYHNPTILARIAKKCFYLISVIDFANQVTPNSQELRGSDMTKMTTMLACLLVEVRRFRRGRCIASISSSGRVDGCGGKIQRRRYVHRAGTVDPVEQAVQRPQHVSAGDALPRPELRQPPMHRDQSCRWISRHPCQLPNFQMMPLFRHCEMTHVQMHDIAILCPN